jgi:hypothetical protein
MRWLLVVTALALGGCEVRSGGQSAPSARYTMVADEQGGVWRLDTQDGTLDRCTAGGDGQVRCVRQAPPSQTGAH